MTDAAQALREIVDELNDGAHLLHDVIRKHAHLAAEPVPVLRDCAWTPAADGLPDSDSIWEVTRVERSGSERFVETLYRHVDEYWQTMCGETVPDGDVISYRKKRKPQPDTTTPAPEAI
jgi:hypothetical protein